MGAELSAPRVAMQLLPQPRGTANFCFFGLYGSHQGTTLPAAMSSREIRWREPSRNGKYKPIMKSTCEGSDLITHTP
jgi:hypothetical protein